MATSPIAYFVTPHGFGHAARAAAVMEALGGRDRDITFEIVTTVPEWFFSRSLSVRYRVRPVVADVGLVQIDPILEDADATVVALQRFWSEFDSVVDNLVQGWRASPPRLVVSDISPLGLEVADRLGVPSILVENFTWDWIYDAYLDTAPGLAEFALRSAEVTAMATHHIQCQPVCRLVDNAIQVGPVSREPHAGRAETRRVVGLDDGDPRPLVLLTMGGMGWGSLKLDLESDLFFVSLGGVDTLALEDPILRLPNRSPIYPPDLVWAADAVIGKLGYSTVAECFRAGTRLGYITRTAFPESPKLERFVRRNLPAMSFGRDQLETQNWRSKLEQLLALPAAAERRGNGAQEIAKILLALLQ
jgi:hypothetical protein